MVYRASDYEASRLFEAFDCGDRDDIAHFTLLGLVGLCDPPINGLQDTMQRLKDMSLKIVICTAEYPVPTIQFARDANLLGEDAIAAGELPNLDYTWEELQSAYRHHRLFGLQPRHKEVNALAVYGPTIDGWTDDDWRYVLSLKHLVFSIVP